MARIAFGIVAAASLALFLWGALAAPVVLWSDSTIDMAWARSGSGIFLPLPSPPPGEPLGHPPKSGYLLFLRWAMRAASALGQGRSVILTQSLLLWLTILATSSLTARRAGWAAGLMALVLLSSTLRIRDASSAVMSEAISAALFLPLAALAIWKPKRLRGAGLLGIGAAVLFAIRPDVGAILFLLTAAVLLAHRSWLSLAVYAAGFVLVVVAVWAATRGVSGSDPLRGAGHPILEASAEYYWHPSLGAWPVAPEARMGKQEIARAYENWRRTLSHWDCDTRRELVWRAFHGLLGTEYYDARWSRLYGSFDNVSRLATPFLILAAIASLLLPSRPPESGSRIAGSLLLLAVVGHDLLFGSNPRYLIPVLPFLLLVLALRLGRTDFPRPRIAMVAAVFALLAVLAGVNRQVLDWEFGWIESAGITIRQPIGRGRLPAVPPATLHIRIAAPLVPTNAQIELAANGRRFWSSVGLPDRARPEIAVALPSWLLQENARHSVELELTSAGDYGTFSYLLFPVIPPPWERPAHRDASAVLSPSTGVRSGSFDWWAHPGLAD